MSKKDTATQPQFPNKRKPFFTCIKAFLRLIRPKTEVLDLNEGKATPGIFLSNHSATSGPLMVELYLPYLYHPWGTYQMNGNIKERFQYLYHIFFRQKKHMKKVPAFVLACLLCTVSKAFYRGMGLISTYPDMRLTQTVEQSISFLADNVSIVIYPEDSSEGYKEKIETFFGGFLLLSQMYYARYGVDLPIYSMYYSNDRHKMVISQPEYVRDLLANGMTKEQICDYFRDKTNALFDTYIADNQPAASV